jgi:hypothetical protein
LGEMGGEGVDVGGGEEEGEGGEFHCGCLFVMEMETVDLLVILDTMIGSFVC